MERQDSYITVFPVFLFSLKTMLSATKRVVGSAFSNSTFIKIARGRVSKGFVRSYIPGRSWKVVGGINLHNGVADIPESSDPIYSSRRKKCGVIVLNRPKVDSGCVDF